ncbi:MAG: hypothetical protein EOM65_00710 [Synergistales bacterium]|nr:hypothetical protein [Synergistales bacterium]
MMISRSGSGSLPILSILSILLACAAGALLLGAMDFPSEAAESAALSLEVTIPEFRGVHLTNTSVSMAAMIGGKPGESAFFFLLSSTGDAPRKLTGRLVSPLPAGLSLTVEITSPREGRSTGPQALGTGEVDLLTGVRGIFCAGGRGTVKMTGNNSLAPGAGQAVLVLTVRDM